MNRAEYINAVVPEAVERKCLEPAEGARILSATIAIMNRANYNDQDLTVIWAEVSRRYGWVMDTEAAPW